ncbi:glycosyltransferase 87 family protein [Corynebacterium capitovis]|uniref:glycosyltransferase 87 family protein n=1 Tax=Corynebacterium capitovis TaxID=131081 RepID=UPI002648B0BD|nr:glycosyltransferase 87 family protein [Corynebacterium capitovis]
MEHSSVTHCYEKSAGYTVALYAGYIVTAFAVVRALYSASTEFMIDIQVFQDTGRALIHGQDLYSEDFPSRSGLRFIYPPFAAALFVPLAPLGQSALQIMWTALSIASAWVILAAVVARLGKAQPLRVATALLGLALLVEPVRSNIDYGQVNLMLFALVAVDVLGFTPRWLRGGLVGIAAGIKIVPGAFAVLFLVRKDWRALGRTVLATLATAAVGFLIRPRESIYFWTHEFFATNRAGSDDDIRNQALSGLLERSGVTGGAADVAVLVLFVACAALATASSWGLLKTRPDAVVEALLLVGVSVWLCSPVTMTHHMAGMVIALPVALFSTFTAARLAAGAFVLVSFLGPPLHEPFAARLHEFNAPVWLAQNDLSLAMLLVMATLLGLALRKTAGGAAQAAC